MSLPYLARLGCLAFACFFLIHLLVGLALRTAGPATIRLAAKIRARDAARLLFGLRLFPAVLSALLVAAFCIPSYLRLEPDEASEQVGLACIAAAVLGLWICGESLFRGLHAVTASLYYVRSCVRRGRSLRIEGDAVCVIDGPAPAIAIAGLFRPTLVASRRVIQALSSEQLDAALKHERAHWSARDNLKRLAVTFAPGMLPGAMGFRQLERAWSRFTEWAADDRAVEGDARRSVVLASTLVCVARLSTSGLSSPVMSSLLAAGDDLSCRVDRLLCAAEDKENPAVRRHGTVVLSGAVITVAMASAICYQSALQAVHSVLECLIR